MRRDFSMACLALQHLIPLARIRVADNKAVVPRTSGIMLATRCSGLSTASSAGVSDAKPL